MFTKDEVKARWAAERQAARDAGLPEPKAGITLAGLVLFSAQFRQKLRDGSDYTTHPLHVAFQNTESTIKQIIGILHDVVEDSDWIVDDLREMGFPERVCRGVDAMTKREDEKYMEFIERCGLSYLNEEGKEDAIDKKIEDLKHNMDTSRTKGIAANDYADLKRQAYNIALYYLIDIKKGKIEPGTKIIDYVRSDPVFSRTPEEVNKVLDIFSSNPERLPAKPPGLATSFDAGTAPA